MQQCGDQADICSNQVANAKVPSIDFAQSAIYQAADLLQSNAAWP